MNQNTLLGITREYGDAFYILDSRQFQKNYTDICNEFGREFQNFRIAYSYKTNYIPKLCRIVNENGGYAEVVSDMEMEIALRVGVQPAMIIWNGPIKNKDKVEELLRSGGTVNVDSLREFNLIQALAQKHPDSLYNIGIRCNFDVGDGVVSRFGFDTESEEFRLVIAASKIASNIHVKSLQCHFAKRDLEYWINRVHGMAGVVRNVEKTLGYIPERIDMGGGMYGNMASSLKAQFERPIPSFAEYARETKAIKQCFSSENCELVIEPGSALVGDCMKFVAKIETIKTVRGKTYATVLGSQKNINMGRINPPMEVIPMGDERKYYHDADIVGYTCIEGDVLYHGYNGELAVGDYLVFSNCGSYSIVMKPPFILPNFPVLDLDKGKIEVVKRQECFDDIFCTFLF